MGSYLNKSGTLVRVQCIGSVPVRRSAASLQRGLWGLVVECGVDVESKYASGIRGRTRPAWSSDSRSAVELEFPAFPTRPALRRHVLQPNMLRSAVARGARASEQALYRSARTQWQPQRAALPLRVWCSQQMSDGSHGADTSPIARLCRRETAR